MLKYGVKLYEKKLCIKNKIFLKKEYLNKDRRQFRIFFLVYNADCSSSSTVSQSISMLSWSSVPGNFQYVKKCGNPPRLFVVNAPHPSISFISV
jgi:hypothetical protein